MVHINEELTLIGSDDEPSGNVAVEAVADLATERNVDVTTAIRDADDSVHQEILEYADAADVDAIVMGTHGRNPRRVGKFGRGELEGARAGTRTCIAIHWTPNYKSPTHGPPDWPRFRVYHVPR